jgi:hypothetical protein
MAGEEIAFKYGKSAPSFTIRFHEKQKKPRNDLQEHFVLFCLAHHIS